MFENLTNNKIILFFVVVILGIGVYGISQVLFKRKTNRILLLFPNLGLSH